MSDDLDTLAAHIATADADTLRTLQAVIDRRFVALAETGEIDAETRVVFFDRIRGLLEGKDGCEPLDTADANNVMRAFARGSADRAQAYVEKTPFDRLDEIGMDADHKVNRTLRAAIERKIEE